MTVEAIKEAIAIFRVRGVASWQLGLTSFSNGAMKCFASGSARTMRLSMRPSDAYETLLKT